MSDRFLQGHYLLGIEGLALLRLGAERRLEGVEARVREIEAIAARVDEQPYSERRDLPEREVEVGYTAWAQSYDDPGNDTIALEEPVVRALLDELPSGPLLDAACGTGRHAAYLAKVRPRGDRVDASEAMLARARAKLSGVDLHLAELAALPFADGAFARRSLRARAQPSGGARTGGCGARSRVATRRAPGGFQTPTPSPPVCSAGEPCSTTRPAGAR